MKKWYEEDYSIVKKFDPLLYYNYDNIIKDCEKAHDFSLLNKKLLSDDKICGCFNCLTIFDPKEITNWINLGSATATCPYCGLDTVIGESSGFTINTDFLESMQARWLFGRNIKPFKKEHLL